MWVNILRRKGYISIPFCWNVHVLITSLAMASPTDIYPLQALQVSKTAIFNMWALNLISKSSDDGKTLNNI
jgi:hypothetical protein